MSSGDVDLFSSFYGAMSSPIIQISNSSDFWLTDLFLAAMSRMYFCCFLLWV